MSVLYFWVPAEPARPTAEVLTSMERAIRVHPGERGSRWNVPGLGLGILEHDPCGAHLDLGPVELENRHLFWMVGEVFRGGSFVDVRDPEDSKRPEIRRALFEALSRNAFEGLSSLDGEYLLVHWDAADRTLTLANDRFGGLPIYWGQSPQGIAFAGGVRGVLMAPGIETAPDPEALKEAVTFGGFRLADRTNVLGVKMLPGGSIVSIKNGTVRSRRYWRYGDIPPRSPETRERLLEQAEALWEEAMRRRLGSCDRPGQTLSGGLDSRAILGEGAKHSRSWAAVTYGIPGCDDARFAERAARAAGARFRFVSLYDRGEDWLTTRTRHVQRTDGLIALGDLMHVEMVGPQSEEMHVHLSGYIGDAVCGPTFSDIETVHDLYRTLPYYGTELGMSGAEAHERLEQMVCALDGAHPRWAVYENKLPQSTNRWTASWRPWLRVRKPFLDYALVDFWLGLPSGLRREDKLYERMLLHRYPLLFRAIPHQKTGVPILTPEWRRQATRAVRFGLRKIGLSKASRQYHDDRGHSDRGIRNRIEGAVLGQNALCCEILERRKVTEILRTWFESGRAPDQVVGALYVYEIYHQGLGARLRAAGG
jgi:asparagine synthase (glutamine-hydrolysing)